MMHRLALSALAALAATTFVTSRAGAQACLGLGSLTSQPANLTVSALFTKGAKAIDGRFGFGSSVAFGGVSGQLQDYDNIDGTGKTIAIDGGLSFLTGTSQNVAVCPVASLGYTSLPDGGTSYGANTTDGAAGIAIGARVGTSSSIALIPFASIQGVYSRISVDVPGGNSRSDNDTYGILSGGMSFVLSPSVLIRPVISIPLGLDSSDPTYGIGLSFGFGKR